MRFMVLVPAGNGSEEGVLPDENLIAEMNKFNEEMVKAGVMLAGEGLHPILEGRAYQVRKREDNGNRRAVHRVEGTDRRLLVDPGQVEGRSDRVDEARPLRRRCGT